jgi:outer membrane protein assembly factor BamA
MTSRGRELLLMGIAVVAESARFVPSVAAQAERPTGLEMGILPAINFDSDEGFGYGVIAELYHYGEGFSEPYVWTLQPTVFLTTEGRRDFTAFFDAPHLLPGGWRLGAFLGHEKHIASPYYGIGNATTYNESLDREDGANPFYYRFGRSRYTASVTLQRRLGDPRVRFLLGGGLERTVIEPVPEASGTTLYAQEVSAAQGRLWSNSVRGGLIWDTRDRETGPRAGTWTELLLSWTPESLGSDAGFARWTFADRRYFALSERLVFAHRYVIQGTSSGAPPHELFRVSSSFKSQEGLGGSKTVRGMPKNRFVGRGVLVWNAELRWRAADFELLGKSFHTVLSAFVDQGRVWQDGVQFGEVLTDLHRGYGGGLRLGMGENFVVAIDGATSSEAGVPIYIGLGYLF